MYSAKLRRSFSDFLLKFCLLSYINAFDQHSSIREVRSEGVYLRIRLGRIEVEDTETRKAMLEEGAAGGKCEIAGAASHCEFGRVSTSCSALVTFVGSAM